MELLTLLSENILGSLLVVEPSVITVFVQLVSMLLFHAILYAPIGLSVL